MLVVFLQKQTTILNSQNQKTKFQMLVAQQEKFDSSYFIGKSHFEEDDTENYLAFQPIQKYIKLITNTIYISSWKFKELYNESVKPTPTSDNSLSPVADYYGSKIKLKFN